MKLKFKLVSRANLISIHRQLITRKRKSTDGNFEDEETVLVKTDLAHGRQEVVLDYKRRRIGMAYVFGEEEAIDSQGNTWEVEVSG